MKIFLGADHRGFTLKEKVAKDIEHKKVTEISGKEIDDLLKDAENYLKRIKKYTKDLHPYLKRKIT